MVRTNPGPLHRDIFPGSEIKPGGRDEFEITAVHLLGGRPQYPFEKRSPTRVAWALCLRYGFDNGEVKTYQRVGGLLGLSRARVRQLVLRAIRMLRHRSRAKFLTPLLREWPNENP